MFWATYYARKVRSKCLATGGGKMVANTPLGRTGQPEDIAKVAVFLASDDAGWVTGERITVAGGLM